MTGESTPAAKRGVRRFVWVVAAALVLVLVAAVASRSWVNPSFATSAKVRFHWGGKAIDATISNANDLAALKDIMKGSAYSELGEPSCGFDSDVSVTLTDGRRSITFCPACDTCAKFRIGNTGKYISVSDKQRRRFEVIVRKYGMTFPCL